MPSDSENLRSVKLPSQVLERVEERLPRSEWDDPAAYVTYVLEEVLRRVEDEDGEMTADTADEKEIRDRLQSLGYLDG